MLLSEIRTIAKTRFRDPDNAIYLDADWNVFINSSNREVLQASHDWPFLESQPTTLVIPAGQGYVDLPADTWRLDSIEERDRGYSDFRIRGNRIHMDMDPPYPSEDITLHVEYRTWPGDMADADEPTYPDVYHYMLIDGALAKAYADDGNMNMAQFHDTKFQTAIERMKDDLLASRGPAYPPILDYWE